MDKAKIQEVLKAGVKLNLEDLGSAPEEGEYDSVDDGIEHKLPDLLEESFGKYGIDEAKQPEGFKIECAEQFGGEDKGDQYWLVFSVIDTATNEQAFVKFTGWYSSNNGHEFDNGGEFDIVEPYEQAVRFWRKKQ